MVMVDAPAAHEILPEGELPIQHRNGSRTQDYAPVISGLGAILVGAIDPRLRDIERTAGGV